MIEDSKERTEFSGTFISDFQKHTTAIAEHTKALAELATKCERLGFSRAARRTKALVINISHAFKLTRDM